MSARAETSSNHRTPYAAASRPIFIPSIYAQSMLTVSTIFPLIFIVAFFVAVLVSGSGKVCPLGKKNSFYHLGTFAGMVKYRTPQIEYCSSRELYSGGVFARF